MPRAFQSLIAQRQQVQPRTGATGMFMGGSSNRIIDFLMRAQQRRTQQQPAKQSGRRRKDKSRIRRRPTALPAERGIDDYR